MNSLQVHRPVVVLALANMAVFIVMHIEGGYWMYRLALWPRRSLLFHDWQMIIYAFAHVSVLHLLTNMTGLLAFGPNVKRRLGSLRFLAFYGLCVLGAAAFHLLMAAFRATEVAEIAGASGSVSGWC